MSLNAVLDNLKCLDQGSGQEGGGAVGAGPPINFLLAAFKIRASEQKELLHTRTPFHRREERNRSDRETLFLRWEQ